MGGGTTSGTVTDSSGTTEADDGSSGDGTGEKETSSESIMDKKATLPADYIKVIATDEGLKVDSVKFDENWSSFTVRIYADGKEIFYGTNSENVYTSLDERLETDSVYPFVEKDKEYKIRACYYYRINDEQDERTGYTEIVTVKTTAGLGEVKILNEDEIVADVDWANHTIAVKNSKFPEANLKGVEIKMTGVPYHLTEDKLYCWLGYTADITQPGEAAKLEFFKGCYYSTGSDKDVPVCDFIVAFNVYAKYEDRWIYIYSIVDDDNKFVHPLAGQTKSNTSEDNYHYTVTFNKDGTADVVIFLAGTEVEKLKMNWKASYSNFFDQENSIDNIGLETVPGSGTDMTFSWEYNAKTGELLFS